MIQTLIVLVVLTALAGAASAQTSDDGTGDQNGPRDPAVATRQAPKKPPKQPAPPLFRKHHRGTYLDAQGFEVVDATPQSPPLETDDPGVPGPGEYEINLTTNADLAHGVQQFDLLLLDANYGLAPAVGGRELPLQIKFECPIAAAAGGDTIGGFVAGIGAAKVGLKVNFYNNEHTGLSVALYPQVAFALAGRRSVERGLREPGQTLILPLLVSKELHYFTLVANAAVLAAIHDPDRPTTAKVSVGGGRALRRKLAVMAEVWLESSIGTKPGPLLAFNGGVIRGAGRYIGYVNVGRSLVAGDGGAHQFVGVGLKVSLTPSTKP